MKAGLWVWPSDSKGQQRALRRVFRSEHLVSALLAISKSKEGLSNAEIDDALSDYSNWMTRWVVDQLLSLGFAEYKVDLFGGPGRYVLTDLGTNALSAITGQSAKSKPTSVPPPAAVAAPPPAPQAKQAATPNQQPH